MNVYRIIIYNSEYYLQQISSWSKDSETDWAKQSKEAQATGNIWPPATMQPPSRRWKCLGPTSTERLATADNSHLPFISDLTSPAKCYNPLGSDFWEFITGISMSMFLKFYMDPRCLWNFLERTGVVTCPSWLGMRERENKGSRWCCTG